MSCFTFLIGIYGISIIYSVFGTTKLDSLSILLSNLELNYYFYIGYILMVISLFFKIGIFPFHFWVMHVYNKSYLIIVIFFSIIPKFGYVYFLWNIVILYNMYYLFVIVGVLSIIYGTILSLFETSLVRLLGYSSISNIGYVIVGLGVGTIDSYASPFFYLFVYTLLLITIFIYI
jgi:NADH:ubiquinone oxidoreductase subunit 2 (subunit N)